MKSSNLLLVLAMSLFASVAVAQCENGRCHAPPTLTPALRQPFMSTPSVRRIERSVLIGGPRYRTRQSYFAPRQFRRYYRPRSCYNGRCR